MLKKIILHIGIPKTGTSTIQSHLSQNRKTLQKNGILYPVTISPYKHVYRTLESSHLLTYSVAGWEPFNLFNPDRFMERAWKTCEQRSLDTMLLSAENTYWLPTLITTEKDLDVNRFWEERQHYLRKLHQLLTPWQPKVVLYLRRQDRWIESWYNQQIKNGNHLTGKFTDFAKRHNVYLDYKKQIDLMADIFGARNIIIRVYEKEQLKQGLFNDFAAATGIGDPQQYPLHQSPRHNAHFSRDVMEVVNIINALDLDKDVKYRLRLLIRKTSNQFGDRSMYVSQNLLSPAERKALIAEYAEINGFVARTYLNRSDGALFYEPTTSDESDWVPYTGVPAGPAIEMLARVFAQADGMPNEADTSEIRDRLENSLIKLLESFGPLGRKLVRRYRHDQEERLWQEYL